MIDHLKSFLDWLGAHVNLVLVAVLMLVGGAWAFFLLADMVRAGSTQNFDDWAIRVLHQPQWPVQDTSRLSIAYVPIGPPWLREIGRDITALGGVAITTLITLAVVGFLWIQDKFGAMMLVLVATVGAGAIDAGLKHIYERGRPGIEYRVIETNSTSFPSGHSMLAATVYLTLGTLLARFTRRRRLKIYFVSIALLLTFLVGVSRVYMGMHWPTDVLAGWTAGLCWALICWLTARILQRRGAVESE